VKDPSLREFYDNIATTRVGAVTDRFRLIVDLATKPPADSVLDIACHHGDMLEMLREKLPNARLVGADISDQYVAQTRARGFEAVECDVTQGLPFESGTFDCVIFGEVIEHLVDPDAALAEIVRVLRVGGRMILTTPNLAVWYNRILLLFGVQPIFTETSLHVNLGRVLKQLGQGNVTQGHLKIFTLRSLREMLDAHGFDIERVIGQPFLPSGVSGVVDRIMANFPSLCSDFVILGRSTGTRRSYLNR
jgi:methionine biosynthesis protein MetW